jgi:hypothetical protein
VIGHCVLLTAKLADDNVDVDRQDEGTERIGGGKAVGVGNVNVYDPILSCGGAVKTGC